MLLLDISLYNEKLELFISVALLLAGTVYSPNKFSIDCHERIYIYIYIRSGKQYLLSRLKGTQSRIPYTSLSGKSAKNKLFLILPS